jgi:hypothetical protein
MTRSEYNFVLHELGLTSYSAPAALGISRRQSYRYAAGDQPVPDVVAKLLAALIELRRYED